eukprot:1586122-Prymnesium_polylepis.1
MELARNVLRGSVPMRAWALLACRVDDISCGRSRALAPSMRSDESECLRYEKHECGPTTTAPALAPAPRPNGGYGRTP